MCSPRWSLGKLDVRSRMALSVYVCVNVHLHREIEVLSWIYTEREADKTGSAQGWPCLAWPALTTFSVSWYGLVKSGQGCGSCQIHPCPRLTHYEAIRDSGRDSEIKKPVPYTSKETLLKHNSKVTQNMLERKNHLLKSRLLGNPWNVSPPVSISVLPNCFPTSFDCL